MKAKQLIKILKQIQPDCEIAIEVDDEIIVPLCEK